MPEPRCLDCGYILAGLEAARCPECGRPFDLALPATYTTKPLLQRWRFWLPGFLLALGLGAVAFPLLIHFVGFGWTVTLGLPLCLGALIGYSARVSPFIQILLGLIVLACLVGLLFGVGILGVYCALILAGVALGPLLVGTIAGAILRMALKRSTWDQRWHLPTLVLLLAPFLACAIEAHYQRPYADETITTSLVMQVPVERAWDSLMFYEEVRLLPPLLMRFALPRPLYTSGSTRGVGDVKVCVYSKGRLVKRITRRVPNDVLAFDVVEQTHIENRSVVLKSGSFRFAPIGPNQTCVTLSTTYRPLLGPRWAWRWAEEIGVHTLHGHVLAGMRFNAEHDATRGAAVAGDHILEPAS